ncbi:hypothetical protein [Actinoplanes sp. NPDC049599]|uniref:hypothetical protein n=1 Tax=Actinoplanes sp. NPDC049599 TaxID=3363903 RepID=UPI0037B004BA
MRRSWTSTNRVPASPVVPARISSSMPARRATSRPAPRTSMFCPLVRRAGDRSTTVGRQP